MIVIVDMILMILIVKSMASSDTEILNYGHNVGQLWTRGLENEYSGNVYIGSKSRMDGL